MQELIDVIRASINADASKEQNAAGVQARRTIATALDTEPGKPLVLPNTKAASPVSGVSFEQLLDLAIARLSMVASDRDTTNVSSEPAAAAPNGLRIPMAGGAPVAAVRSAASRSVAGARTNPRRRPERGRPVRARAATIARPLSAPKQVAAVARPNIARKS